MFLYIVFFGSLLGLILLFSLKIYELDHGVKFFSVARFRVDSVLRQKLLTISTHTKFVNGRTFRLLVLFLLEQLRRLLARGWIALEESKLGRVIRGTEISPRNGKTSDFLKQIENEKKDNQL